MFYIILHYFPSITFPNKKKIFYISIPIFFILLPRHNSLSQTLDSTHLTVSTYRAFQGSALVPPFTNMYQFPFFLFFKNAKLPQGSYFTFEMQEGQIATSAHLQSNISNSGQLELGNPPAEVRYQTNKNYHSRKHQ